jgi:serine/threonine protein phosphatase PrpC
MEDQHLIDTAIPGIEGHSMYAVFDGHGGKNAAIFAAERLVHFLLHSPSFSSYLADKVRC